MGGPVPLGYDVVERKLVVSEKESKLVRHIMQRYVDLGSVKELIEELDRDGYRTKIQNRKSTGHRGGCPFRRGTLYHLLANRIYLGEIVHKGTGYPGEHKPVISTQLWDQVQDALAVRSQGGTSRSPAKWPSLLTGLIVDGEGRAMSPSHANKGKKRYRYYITRPDQLDSTPAWRVSAYDLERLVCSELIRFLKDQHRIQNVVLAGHANVQQLRQAFKCAEDAAVTLESGVASEKQRLLRSILDKAQLREDGIAIHIEPTALRTLLGTD